MTPISSITRKSGLNASLNILTYPTHESFETGLARTGHNFYAYRCPQVKDWDPTYRPVPKNYILLNPSKNQHQLLPEVDFDCVLSQNKFGQYQIASQISRLLHLPLISLEHTLALPSWPKAYLTQLKAMRGDINVFISDYSREKWGWGQDEAIVIHHGIDTELFCPGDGKKGGYAGSCVNDFVNRDVFCGFRLWQEVTKGLPHKLIGKTPGLSEPAKNVSELVQFYRSCNVFLNTSLVSPIPTVVLEALACGVPCVSTDNCMLPEIIKHGYNGFLSNDPHELRKYCQLLINDHDMAKEMGNNARQTIVEKFSLERFVSQWNEVFAKAAGIVYGVPHG